MSRPSRVALALARRDGVEAGQASRWFKLRHGLGSIQQGNFRAGHHQGPETRGQAEERFFGGHAKVVGFRIEIAVELAVSVGSRTSMKYKPSYLNRPYHQETGAK